MDFGLAKLNSLPAEKSEIEFLNCCGAKAWAARMTAERPFADVAALLDRADTVWWSLATADWLEAFRSHPRIGEKKAAQTTSAQAQAWSEQEQSGAGDTAPDIVQSLAGGNGEYEQRFGYTFIVCATGKSSEEMLALLRERLKNDADSEGHTAAEEQRKITKLRLGKLLEGFRTSAG